MLQKDNEKQKNILIVDDDDDLAASMKLSLESKGYTVIHAPAVSDAAGMIELKLPDLIIMDVMMKHACDGFDFSRKLKRNEKYKDIPILMVTAVSEKTGFQYSPDMGDSSWLPVDGYMTKPVDMNELVKKIEALLTR